MVKISIIVPCYCEEQALMFFYEKINSVASQLPYAEIELLFIDDGSKDGTLNIIKELSSRDNRVKYISFSRNFGKEAAIYAGLQNCTGDLAAIMDADLQDPPELLPEMYKYIMTEGYDIVAARRVTRKGEPTIRSFFAGRFYKIINKMTKIEIVDGARDFRLMTQQVVNAVLRLKEYNRFSKGIFCWVGFRTKWLEYENVKRVAGETKWSFWKLLIYSLDGIVAFSTAPLAAASLIGLAFCMLSFIMICFIIAKTLIFDDPVAGWPSMVCIIFFVGGVQLFCTGILGQYVSKSYLETKKRPIYIIRETNQRNAIKELDQKNTIKEMNQQNSIKEINQQKAIRETIQKNAGNPDELGG
jgi:glucosyltransferase